MRLHFFRIEGEHLLHANWPLQTTNSLQCHRTHANWPSQTAIITDRAVYNAIQPVRRCASAITKKHATQNPERDALKRGELDDEASPTFPKKHRAAKYGGEHTRHYRKSSRIIKCPTLLLLTGSNGSWDNRGGRRRAGQIQSYNTTSV